MKKKTSSSLFEKKISNRYSDLISETMKLEEKEKKEEKVKIKRKKIMELINDHKFNIILGTLGGLIYGACSPISGLLLGKITNIFALDDLSRVKSESLILALMYIVIGIISGVCIFLKVYKLEGLGAVITSRMRKKILQKYLEFHMGYYDIDANSPGGLLTKLSIDTTQLNALILSVFGSIISTSGTILTALIIGFIYDWKLSLIFLAFIPFIVMFNVLMGEYRENGRVTNKEIRIEAGSILSECVINTKTIFSYNFQQQALEIYKNILEKETKAYLKDSIMLGVLIGSGIFILFASHSVVYKCSYIFIKKRTLTFNNMNNVMNTLMNATDGIADSLHGIGDYRKAKLSFKSLFKIMETPSEINAFEYTNKDKIFPEIFKGKIEFRNVTFSYPT